MLKIERLTFLIMTLLASQAVLAGQPSADVLRRGHERQVRQVIMKDYANAYKRAHNSYLNGLSGACQWLITLQAKEEAEKILVEMEATDSKFFNIASLKKGIAGIAVPAKLDEAKLKEFAAKMKNAYQERSRGLLKLADTCYMHNLFGYAYDLVWDILKTEPDNQIARKAVGFVKVGKEWQSAYAAMQLQKGNKYVPDAGWVPGTAVEKVTAGQWFENGRFMPMEDADKLHSSRSTPWIIETENFTLKSTATRKQAIAISERLESIRSFCFRQYLEFFMRGSDKRGAGLLFNQVAQKKMLVNYFGTKDDYDAAINTEMKGPNKDLLIRSAGFYTPSTHASYFYHDKNFGPFQIFLMQHEVTHQILGEYSRGGSHQTWLTEGVAEVLEPATPGPDGQLTLARGHDHPNVQFAARLLKKNELPPVSEVLSLTNDQFHNEDNRTQNYKLSGAICRALLEMKDSALAADFLEYLYDSYKGGRANLADYIGMDAAALDKEFRQYLGEEKN